MKKILLTVIATALCGSSSIAYGAVGDLININFGTFYSGAAATGASGDSWNSLDSSSLTDYHKSFGGSGSISLFETNGSIGGEVSTWQFNGESSIDSSKNAFDGKDGYGLMRQYDYVNIGSENVGSFTLSNLEAGIYNIYVYSQSETDTTSPAMTVKINGNSYITPETLNTYSNFEPNNNYFVYTVTIAGGQDLVMQFYNNSTTPSSKAAINGLQIEAVPEPGSIVLLGIGGALLFGFRKLNSKEESSVIA